MANNYVPWRKKLLDPRWQKKRLEILERANWACEACGETTKTLHVHHGFYDSQNPWDYPDWSLRCLCVDCHETIGYITHDIQVELSKLTLHRLEMLLDAIGSTDWNSLPAGELKIISGYQNGSN